MELKFTVQTKIQKPLAEVFDAVYNPSKIAQYFATGGASAPLDAGTTVIWQFADFPGEVPVRVKEVVPNQRIAFEWDAGEGNTACRVEMKFESLEDGSTMVSITESGWPATQKGLDLSYGNCMGWSHMAAFLKAWLEYGVNLRKGAY
jgi:uncharacterized protein YndB with AHSA1/START domain